MEDKELENGYDEVRHRKLFTQKHYDMQCIKTLTSQNFNGIL